METAQSSTKGRGGITIALTPISMVCIMVEHMNHTLMESTGPRLEGLSIHLNAPR